MNTSRKTYLTTIAYDCPGLFSVQELSDKIGCSASTAYNAIRRLELDGLLCVDGSIRTDLRGRPAHLYRLTEHGWDVLGEVSAEVAA